VNNHLDKRCNFWHNDWRNNYFSGCDSLSTSPV